MTVPDAMRINSPEQPSDPWKHDHCFGQDQKKPGEARTGCDRLDRRDDGD